MKVNANVEPAENLANRVLKLLIVEDEFIIANNLRSLLEGLGHQVIGIARSVDKALPLLDEQLPDLVLLDIYLKGTQTGIDLARKLKESYRLPFVFISSHSDKITLGEASATEPYGYIHKPFQQKDIDATLQIAQFRLAHSHENQLRRKNDVLLGLSQAIATLKDKGALIPTIIQHIHPLYEFIDVGLGIFESDSHDVADWRVTNPASFRSAIQAIVAGPRAAPGSVASLIEQCMLAVEQAGAPRLIQLDTTLAEAWPELPYRASKQRNPVKELVHANLKVGGKLIGFIHFNATQAGQLAQTDHALLQAIADQLAVAVANILAYEEIRQREREKDLQINLTNALTKVGDWSEKLISSCKVLQPELGFDYLAVWLEQRDRTYYQGFRRIGYDEYQAIDVSALQRMSGLEPGKQTAQLQTLFQQDAQWLNGDLFVAFSRRFPLARVLAELFKQESALLLPVHLVGQTKFLVWVGSESPHRYGPVDLNRLQALMMAITPSLEKILAYEEIRQLKEQLEVENDYLQEELKTTHNFEEIIGASDSLQLVFRRINLVAATHSTVLLEGETGTGKELFARAIHAISPRRDRVLVKVNCAALPANLIESELFGHEKGAFTGAIERRIGKFELAHGGTLFLDEIGEMPLELQPKLLRALQEKEIERVGGRQIITCDVRIITATNRHLEREVAEGRFRQDLFYRLNVFSIQLPPLRQRTIDINLLASHFLHKFAKRFGRPARCFSTDALREMQAYDWPGNIRELEHVVEQALIVSETPVVELTKSLKRSNRLEPNPDQIVLKTWQDAERDNILAVLNFTNGRIRGKGGAADLLGLNASTLDSRMKTLNISKSYGEKTHN